MVRKTNEFKNLTSGELKIYRLLKNRQIDFSRNPLDIDQISRKTGLAKSSVMVYLSSMKDKGVNIERRMEGGKYIFWLQVEEKATQTCRGPEALESADPMAKSAGKVETFTDILRKNTERYYGLHSDDLKHVPQFFELFQDLSGKTDLDSATKRLVNSVISYFVLPSDVIPEKEWGALGYIDDLYLCAYVVNELRNYGQARKLIESCWREKEDVFELAEQLIAKIECSPNPTIRKLLKEVLDFAGLKELDGVEADDARTALSVRENQSYERELESSTELIKRSARKSEALTEIKELLIRSRIQRFENARNIVVKVCLVPGCKKPLSEDQARHGLVVCQDCARKKRHLCAKCHGILFPKEISEGVELCSDCRKLK